MVRPASASERSPADESPSASEPSVGGPTKGGPQPRVSSPLPGVSTLITRAPRSASIIAACGPASARVRSTTVISASGPPFTGTSQGFSAQQPLLSQGSAWQTGRNPASAGLLLPTGCYLILTLICLIWVNDSS